MTTITVKTYERLRPPLAGAIPAPPPTEVERAERALNSVLGQLVDAGRNHLAQERTSELMERAREAAREYGRAELRAATAPPRQRPAVCALCGRLVTAWHITDERTGPVCGPAAHRVTACARRVTAALTDQALAQAAL